MDEQSRVERLSKPFAFYTVLLGLLTVGVIFLLTRSGAVILVAAGVGLLLVVVGGGTAGPTSAAGAEHAEDAGLGLMVEDTGLWPTSYGSASLRVVLLFYGLGVFLWSLVALGTLGSSLR